MIHVKLTIVTIAYECIARLIHCHWTTCKCKFPDSSSGCYKNSIHWVQPTITIRKPCFAQSFFGRKHIERAGIFGGEKWYFPVPVTLITSLGCSATQDLNSICERLARIITIKPRLENGL